MASCSSRQFRSINANMHFHSVSAFVFPCFYFFNGYNRITYFLFTCFHVFNRQGITRHKVSLAGNIKSWLRQDATRFRWPALLHLQSLSLPLQWRNLGVIPKTTGVFFVFESCWNLMQVQIYDQAYIRLFSLLCIEVDCLLVPTVFWEVFQLCILDFW